VSLGDGKSPLFQTRLQVRRISLHPSKLLPKRKARLPYRFNQREVFLDPTRNPLGRESFRKISGAVGNNLKALH